ncbi:MAG: GAF domain-containing protein [Alicyclobacillus sp.]|nr:GAF domain-containing protein [Alicyclobacillus sp.]
MFTETKVVAATKAEFYEQVAAQTRHLMDGEPNWVANLSNVSALLNLHLTNINWVGFYLYDEARDELVLGPFQGKPACIRIGPGKGVCGTAFANVRTLVVPDVNAFPGHIACDSASRSEVVVPLCVDGQCVGVLDIDAPVPARFDEADGEGLERVAAAIASCAGLPARSGSPAK